jgi:hypothetical protein
MLRGSATTASMSYSTQHIDNGRVRYPTSDTGQAKHFDTSTQESMPMPHLTYCRSACRKPEFLAGSIACTTCRAGRSCLFCFHPTESETVRVQRALSNVQPRRRKGPGQDADAGRTPTVCVSPAPGILRMSHVAPSLRRLFQFGPQPHVRAGSRGHWQEPGARFHNPGSCQTPLWRCMVAEPRPGASARRCPGRTASSGPPPPGVHSESATIMPPAVIELSTQCGLGSSIVPRATPTSLNDTSNRQCQ